MRKKFKIAYVSGSRADYGIVRHYLNYLNKDEEIEFEVLVTGALLSNEYGYSVDLIKKDGFQIGAEVEVSIDTRSNAGIIRTMSDILCRFGEFFNKNKYDLLILLGDRYEILSVAIAAAMQRISILHIHGGEATYANYDEFIRHSITKMARFHFTSTEEYRHRIIQMGENPNTVFNLGALGAENCLRINKKNVPEEIKKLASKDYFVILFHPETLTDIRPKEQIKEIINALNMFPYIKMVFIGSNADTYSDQIRLDVMSYVDQHENACYYENLHTDAYHDLVKHAICLIGNSSSGIIEAPSLETWTINIGDRQKGRVKGNSIVDVMCLTEQIIQGINQVLSRQSSINFFNPYYKKDSAKLYYSETIRIINMYDFQNVSGAKPFFDIEYNHHF